MLSKAQMVARRSLEKIYDDRATVIVRERVTNPETHVRETNDKTIYTNIPCRLSYHSVDIEDMGDRSRLQGTMTLFVSPEVLIPAGSKIILTKNPGDHEIELSHSSVPKIYPTHWEYDVDLFKGWV